MAALETFPAYSGKGLAAAATYIIPAAHGLDACVQTKEDLGDDKRAGCSTVQGTRWHPHSILQLWVGHDPGTGERALLPAFADSYDSR